MIEIGCGRKWSYLSWFFSVGTKRCFSFLFKTVSFGLYFGSVQIDGTTLIEVLLKCAVQDVVSHIYCLQVLFFLRILIVAPFTQLDNISWRLRELFQLYIFGNIYKEFRGLSDSITNIKSVLQNILLGGSVIVCYILYYTSWLIGSNLVI